MSDTSGKTPLLQAAFRTRSAAIGSALWTGEMLPVSDFSCPICRVPARVALLVEDLIGQIWGLGEGCNCGPEAGAVRHLDGPAAQVRPGSPGVSYRFFQAADDDRWKRAEEILAGVDAVSAEAIIETAIASLEPTGGPGLNDPRIGGGLDAFVSAVEEDPRVEIWQGRAAWQTLCVLDAGHVADFIDPATPFDMLLAIVDAKSGTGLWMIA